MSFIDFCSGTNGVGSQVMSCVRLSLTPSSTKWQPFGRRKFFWVAEVVSHLNAGSMHVGKRNSSNWVTAIYLPSSIVLNFVLALSLSSGIDRITCYFFWVRVFCGFDVDLISEFELRNSISTWISWYKHPMPQHLQGGKVTHWNRYHCHWWRAKASGGNCKLPHAVVKIRGHQKCCS